LKGSIVSFIEFNDNQAHGLNVRHSSAVMGALSSMVSQFTGWPVDNIEDIWQTAVRGGFYRGGPVLMSALSGIDIALWDLKGKILGVPVWSLLGGKVREKLKVYVCDTFSVTNTALIT
jgi:L-alanine-DL-glutamate epimerase-like enolase superfamily enzyme